MVARRGLSCNRVKADTTGMALLDAGRTIEDPRSFLNPMYRHDLAELDLGELEQALETMGHPRFHARQLFQWVHRRGVTDFAEMTDLGRELRASLAGAFVQEDGGELMLHGLIIPERAYGRHGTRALHQPRRTRKLLLHRSEIDKIIGRLGDAGVTLVPLSLYFQDGWVKVEIALARGRRSFDKRQAIAQRDADREIARELSDRLRGRRRRARGPG